MAVSFGHSSSGGVTSGTSLSFNHTITTDNYLMLVLNSRLVTGGCAASDITNVAVTYAGTPMGFLKGSANVSEQFNPASDCVHARVLFLPNPTMGTNLISITWTSSAFVQVVAQSFNNFGSLGSPIGEQKATGTTWSAAATIGPNDMVVGTFSFADTTANFSSANANFVSIADAGGNQAAAMMTNQGTGSIPISGTSSNFGHITYAFPLLETPATSIKTVMGLDYASVKTVMGLPKASVKTIMGLA